jgi:hypothetical protein
MNAKKTRYLNSAVTAEISLFSGEIPLSPWDYVIPNFRYHKMYITAIEAGRQLSRDI